MVHRNSLSNFGHSISNLYVFFATTDCAWWWLSRRHDGFCSTVCLCYLAILERGRGRGKASSGGSCSKVLGDRRPWTKVRPYTYDTHVLFSDTSYGTRTLFHNGKARSQLAVNVLSAGLTGNTVNGFSLHSAVLQSLGHQGTFSVPLLTCFPPSSSLQSVPCPPHLYYLLSPPLYRGGS